MLPLAQRTGVTVMSCVSLHLTLDLFLRSCMFPQVLVLLNPFLLSYLFAGYEKAHHPLESISHTVTCFFLKNLACYDSR